MQKLFPTILMLLDIAAAIVYLGQGDIKKTIYWLAAAALTASVTF
jgi:c-di-GMP-related signal transduction protein